MYLSHRKKRLEKDQDLQEIISKQNNTYEKLEEAYAKLYERMVITESNLNYYRMIDNIQKEFNYSNLELLMNPVREGTRILITGFYGACNLGDELMLQVLIQCLRELGMDNITVLLCDNEKYDFFDYPAIQFIHYPKNKFDFNIIAQQYDVLIWGGGAMIDDACYGTDDVSYLGNMYIELTKRFLAFNKKCISLALSSNRRLKNEKYIEALKYVIENSTYFSTRDKYTSELLREIGIAEDKIHFLDDLVFSSNKWNRIRQESYKKKGTKQIIGIVFVCYESTRELLKTTIQDIAYFYQNVERAEYEIRCIPFYAYNDNDYNFYRSVIDEVKEENGEIQISVCPYRKKFEDIIKELYSLDFVINMRYHAMLLSMMLGKTSLNICLDNHEHYYNKVRFITELGRYDDSVIMLSEAINDPEGYKDRIIESIRQKKVPYIDMKTVDSAREKLLKALQVTLLEEV